MTAPLSERGDLEREALASDFVMRQLGKFTLFSYGHADLVVSWQDGYATAATYYVDGDLRAMRGFRDRVGTVGSWVRMMLRAIAPERHGYRDRRLSYPGSDEHIEVGR